MQLKIRKITVLGALIMVLMAGWLLPLFQSRRDVVNIDAGTFREVFSADAAVLDLLSDALKRNPNADEFRIRYTTYRGAGQFFEANLDYNRLEKRAGERSCRSGANYRYFYQGVSEADIDKLAASGGNISRIKDGRKIKFEMHRDYFSGLKFHLLNR